MNKTMTDEYGQKWRQVWWVQDHATGNCSRDFVTLAAALREKNKPRWIDPQLFADIQCVTKAQA